MGCGTSLSRDNVVQAQVSVTPVEPLGKSKPSTVSGRSLTVTKEQTISEEPGWVFSIAALGNDRFVTSSADCKLRIWDATSGKCLQVLDGHTPAMSRAVAALYGDGRFVSGSDDFTLKIWSVQTGGVLHSLTGHTDKVISAAVVSDGHLVSGSDDCTVRVWHFHTGLCEHVCKGHEGWVHTVAALGSGLVASGSQDKQIRIWRVDTGTCVHILNVHAGSVRCVAALPGGQLRFVSAANDATLCVFFVDTGDCAFTLEGHKDRVSWVAVCEEGLIVSASGDHTIRCWNSDTGQCLKVLECHTSLVNSVIAVGNGRLVSGSADQTLQIWNSKLGSRLCSPLLLLCSMEHQVKELLSMETTDVCYAASLLQLPYSRLSCLGSGGPECSRSNIAFDLEQKVVKQTIKQLPLLLKESLFQKEALTFTKSHPELQAKGGSCKCAFSDVDVRMASFNRCDTAVTLWFFASLRDRMQLCLPNESLETLKEGGRLRLKWASSTGDAAALRYAVLLAKHLQGLNLLKSPEGMKAMDALREAALLPSDWDIHAMVRDRGDVLITKKEIAPDASLFLCVQELLDKTFVAKESADRQDKMPDRMELKNLFAVQNEALWVGYQRGLEQTRADIGSLGATPDVFTDVKTDCGCLPALDATVCEHWLWHGTSHKAVEGITDEDFRIDLSGLKSGMMFGPGVYLAECSSKSDEYTQKDESGTYALLLCRATCGRILYNADEWPDSTSFVSLCRNGGYHSVLGDREKVRGTYRETIVYDSDLVYPAYIVLYSRVFGAQM